MSTPADDGPASTYTVFFELKHPERLAPAERAMIDAAYALAKKLIAQFEEDSRRDGNAGELTTTQFYALLLAGSIIARSDGCSAAEIAATTRYVAQSITVHGVDDAAPS
jgi:hypothetical protein